MKTLNLNFTIEISEEEAEAIADALGCSTEELSDYITPYAKASLREYADMFAGQAMTGVSDLRERRLAAILLSLPNADFPADERIARLFNLTSSQGRGLLRASLSRHRNHLKPAVESAARRFIEKCPDEPDEGYREARCRNAVIIEMLNAQLAANEEPRTPIRRKVGTFDTYIVSNGAYIELKRLYP